MIYFCSHTNLEYLNIILNILLYISCIQISAMLLRFKFYSTSTLSDDLHHNITEKIQNNGGQTQYHRRCRLWSWVVLAACTKQSRLDLKSLKINTSKPGLWRSHCNFDISWNLKLFTVMTQWLAVVSNRFKKKSSGFTYQTFIFWCLSSDSA